MCQASLPVLSKEVTKLKAMLCKPLWAGDSVIMQSAKLAMLCCLIMFIQVILKA